jgi:sarcosine oxidase subunit delta
MLYIPCPHCGSRDETEFAYGGPSHITRPELTASDREWTHYLYHRSNPKFNVLRDTATHEILEVYLMGQSGYQGHASQLGDADCSSKASQ